MRTIILASGSPRRKELLERAGLKFMIEPSDFDEDIQTKLHPRELVKQLAVGKASSVALRHKNAIVIGADTVVALGNKIWSKPETKARAKMMLRALSGKSHDVWTGFCIIDTKTGKRKIDAVRTRVTMRKLSEKQIDRYVATGESLDAAGAYKIQAHGWFLIEKIDGNFTNVIGLPLSVVLNELKKFS